MKSETPIKAIESQSLPAHILYDAQGTQACLGDFIADITQLLYRKAKRKFLVPSSRQSKPTILCIDNEEMIQVALAEYINRNGCLQVRAMNSQEAYAALDAQLPNLIFLDIHMPGNDTLALLKDLKNNPKTKAIPVVIVTGMNDIGLISSYLDAGADDYFLKAFHPEQIHKQFSLDMQKPAAPEIITAPAPQTTPTPSGDDTTQNNLNSILILLDGAAQKLEASISNGNLNREDKHNLNNVLFGIVTAKQLIERER